jgi:RNA polymerase sigma-70 factor (ECF subfamily)
MHFLQLCYCVVPAENLLSAGLLNEALQSAESITVTQTRMSIDSNSLDSFLRQIEKRAYRMAHFATSNVDDALDIVQDAMLVLASKYANRKQDEWPPLFYRILQNKIRDYYRRQKVRNIYQHWFSSDNEEHDEDPIQMIADDSVHDPVRKISGEKEIEKLEQALKTLPARQQQTFLLRAWEGLDVKQTAQAMGITTGSVKTHYSRALQALKKKTGEAEYE